MPGLSVDVRRFRMNLIVETKETEFVENGWIGQQLAIGGAVRLGVALLDPRCVMTTLAQDELPSDTDVLRALARHKRIQVGDLRLYPFSGAYTVRADPELRLRSAALLAVP